MTCGCGRWEMGARTCVIEALGGGREGVHRPLSCYAEQRDGTIRWLTAQSQARAS